MLSMDDPAVMAAEAATLSEQLGVRSFKVKIDPDIDATVVALRAIREAIGAEAVLYVDANRSMRPHQVLRAVRLLRDVDLALFEDPTEIADEEGRAQLARRLEMPIMADETARTLGAAANELRSARAGIVSIKTARTGFTGSRRILGLAEGLHARTLMGSQGDASIGVAAGLCFGAAHLSTARESGELDFFRQLAGDIVTERPEIREGLLRVPVDLPGIGVEIDEEQLQRYRVDL
jgi:L-alanine-DL-glutamate epimerase-like enolase superfamily enzyme